MSTAESAEVLIAGAWKTSEGKDAFVSVDPRAEQELGSFPVSPWSEIDEALEAGALAGEQLQDASPELVASFLERFADRIDSNSEQLVQAAHLETALPTHPRLADVELPRTTDQLRQAAAAARHRTWREPVLSPAARIASLHGPIPGVVCVFGPNNFPFAFNSVAGGDFAAAVATGHPVIAKANSGHPETTRLLASEAHVAAADVGLPAATVQLIYKTGHEDGFRMVADSRVAATAYTGSRRAGLALKAAADAAGRPIYLELSSINPVVVLAGAWEERGHALAEEVTASMLAGSGQFCTSPGLILTPAGSHVDGLRRSFKKSLEEAPSGTLLDESVELGLRRLEEIWSEAGAVVVAKATERGPGCSFPNTMLEVSGDLFLENTALLQQEAFGNLSLLLVARNLDQLVESVRHLEGNLTGSIYSATDGGDDEAYEAVASQLRDRVGRLLNNKTPTGVAVVAAMNHGGPYPSTGHPGFTAVGIPASLRRFAMLQSYDNVPDHRLPAELQAENPLGLQRLVDGTWTTESVSWGGDEDLGG